MATRHADAVFYNGRIHTIDRRRPTARAIAVEDGKIVAVGGDIEIRGNAPRGCSRFDLEGKVVVPGFIDSHTHFVQMGVDSMSVDLFRARSLEQAKGLMRSAAKGALPGEWIVGTGWNEGGWTSSRFLAGSDLDACCPDNPAVAHRICGHLSTVNSRAISLLGIDAETPGAELGASGNPTGILRESAVTIARSAVVPNRSTKLRGLASAIKKAHSLGVTSIQDNGDSEDVELYSAALKVGRLGVRVWFNTPASNLDSMIAMSIPTGFGSDWLKVGGLKVFCDGAFGARTAALSEPYSDDPGNRGMFVHEREKFEEIISKANDAGIQLAIHAIGDEGIDLTISSLAAALARTPQRNARHRIEHLELPSLGHLRDMQRLGIIASMQPNFVGQWGAPGGLYYLRLAERRALMNNPFKEVLRARVKLAFGSDCMPFSPMYGIHSAVNAPHLVQRISVLQAIEAYTKDAAFASFDEGVKGTIAEGKFADLAVLSANPFEEPARISSIRVLKTVVAGRVVYDIQKASSR